MLLLQNSLPLCESTAFTRCVAILLKKTQKEWQIVFFICAAIYFAGGTVYIILCRSDIQPWAVAELAEAEDSGSAKKLHAHDNPAFEAGDLESVTSYRF